MSMMLRWSCVLMVGALLIAGPSVRAQDENEPMLTLDEEYALLAEEVPGFGGLYLDEEGTTHVYLQDLSRAREIQDLGERVEVHQGEYDFRDLFAWKREVRDLLAQPGALSLDIDEQRNRLSFGVEREALDAFTAELPALLRSTRVPLEAVLVEAAEPTLTQEQLIDKIRPIPGGVQIQNWNGGTCTLGVNAIRPGANSLIKGFVTNSHCTDQRGAVEGTVFAQNVLNFGNLVGTEIADPNFFTNLTNSDCPSGRKCRYSDAVFVDYVGDQMSEGGKIANPIFCGSGGFPGTLDVFSFQPRLPVAGPLFSNPSGSILTKVGRTTGCTFGSVKETCTDVKAWDKHPLFPGYIIDTGITMLCQNRVSALSQGGDSGSPVFLNQDGEAWVAGILWGGNGSSFVYSPWQFVQAELGVFLEQN